MKNPDKDKFFDTLPDETPFDSWEPGENYSKTYFVRQQQENASDANPGTAEQPFRTIGQAARVLMPGERVLIGSGLYREFVQPVRGGTGPDALIGYEAEEGAKAVLSGTEVWETEWVPSVGWSHMAPPVVEVSQPDPKAVLWQGRLPREAFETVNPFAMANMPSHPFGGCEFLFQYLPKDAPYWEYLNRRGLFIVDGKPLKQVTYYFQLSRTPGTFWVEDDGLTLHFRLPDDGSPWNYILEFTAREQLFRPEKPYFSYVRVKGLQFEFVGNGFPGSQKGALSTFCGHHWVIENNRVRWANSIGIDIGHESPLRRSEHLAGFQIVRGNVITDCGICGVCGLHGGSPDGMKSTLIENNRFERICWHNTEYLYECAAIKLHGTRDCMIRHNIVLDTQYGSGIWLDYNIVNTRVCNNVVQNIRKTMYGAIFIEASQKPNLVDNNVVSGVGADPLGIVTQCNDGGGHGIYEHDCDYLVIRDNFVFGIEGSAIFLNVANPDRNVNNRMPTGRRMKVLGNFLCDAGMAIVFPYEDNFSDGNIFGAGSFKRHGPLRIHRVYKTYEALNLEAWRDFHGWDLNGKELGITANLDRDNLRLSVRLTSFGESLEKSLDLNGAFHIDNLK